MCHCFHITFLTTGSFLFCTGSLDDVLTEALLKNKVKFVELILQQGVVMKEFLTVERLERLYLEVSAGTTIFYPDKSGINWID